MTLFAFLFPSVAVALWRAGRGLEPHQRLDPYPTMPDRITTTAAIAIVATLVSALGDTRAALKAAREKLQPTEDELAQYKADDEALDAKLLEAKAQLDAWAAEDAAAEPPTDPEPPAEPDGGEDAPPTPDEQPTPDPDPDGLTDPLPDPPATPTNPEQHTPG